MYLATFCCPLHREETSAEKKPGLKAVQCKRGQGVLHVFVLSLSLAAAHRQFNRAPLVLLAGGAGYSQQLNGRSISCEP